MPCDSITFSAALTNHTVHLALTILLGCIAFGWLTYGVRTALGGYWLPRIEDTPPAADSACPSISLLFGARDEAEKLPEALATLAALDYPRLEIIAVDDRSEDTTGRLLDDFAAAQPRARVVHVRELPPGWLGKPHALQRAYEASRSEWLLFTDADVQFSPQVLRRAIALAGQMGLDHLTLAPEIEMVGFWEKVIIPFFSLGFHLRFDPYRVSDPRSRRFAGIGAFQLVRRSAYEAAGTHRRLAMEVLDDMKLGKIVKQAGFRSAVALAISSLSVRWHAGPGNIVRGVTKNFFAGANYSVAVVALQFFGMLAMNLLPFAEVAWGTGWARVFAGAAVFVILGFHAGVAVVLRTSPFYALTHPLGAVILSYMLLRSTVVTLWRGGVEWRGTFYALDELKRGLV
jgi:glycosyltransferase involved in cell wall biosynthesis